MTRSLTHLLAVASGAVAKDAKGVPWQHAGPGGYVNLGDDLEIPSAGAAQALVQLAGEEYLLATANGGIWKSSNALSASPSWTNVLDGQPAARRAEPDVPSTRVGERPRRRRRTCRSPAPPSPPWRAWGSATAP